MKNNQQKKEEGLESSNNLFNFREIKLEGGIDPRQDLSSSNEISAIHHSNVGGRHLSFFWELGLELGEGKRLGRASFGIYGFPVVNKKMGGGKEARSWKFSVAIQIMRPAAKFSITASWKACEFVGGCKCGPHLTHVRRLILILKFELEEPRAEFTELSALP